MNTVEDVKKLLKHIKRIRSDAECAHAYEDELHQAVLLSIADG